MCLQLNALRYDRWMSSRILLRLILVLLTLAAFGCPSDSDGDDDATGGDGGPRSDAAVKDRDAGDRSGETPQKDAGDTKKDAGKSGQADSGSAHEDAGKPMTSGTGGSGSSDDCTPAAGATPTWTEVDPMLPDFEVRDVGIAGTPPPAGFGGIAYGNGLFVVTGPSLDEDHMRWATSPDGVTWKAHTQPIATGKSYSTSRVHFVLGKFVYFAEHSGDGFHVYTSSDGLAWTSSKIQDDRFIVDEFAASDDQVVVVGESGKALRSSNLKDWTPVETVPGGGLFSYNDVEYGNGRWVAAINNGGQVYGSADGASWDVLDGFGTPGGFRVEFGHDLWVATAPSMYLTSSDGIAFDAFMPEGGHNSAWMRFAGGRFIDFSYDLDNSLLFTTSDDGKVWSAYGKLPPETLGANEKTRTRLVKDIAYGNCRYVVAGVLATQTNPSDPANFLSATQSVLPLVMVGELAPK